MVVEPFSAAHLLPILLEAALVAALFFSLRKQSDHAKFVTLLVLMGLNLLQHLFKGLLWPHLFGQPFGYTGTAYNVCALLLLASPFVHLFGSRSAKAYLSVAGTASGLVPILYPVDFFGESLFQWEWVRSWTCHALLLCTSLLPVLWRWVRFDFRDTWKTGLWFVGTLLFVAVNDVVFYLLFGAATKETLWGELFLYNPMMIMGPEPYLPKWIVNCVPDFLLKGMGGKPFPVLWYAHLMYIGVSLLGIALDFVWDKDFLRFLGYFLHIKMPPPLGKRHKLFRNNLTSCTQRKNAGGQRLRTKTPSFL